MSEQNNSGWIYGHQIYIHKLVIKNGEVEYTPSLMQKIKAAFGLGPTKEQVEKMWRTEVMGKTE